MQRPTRRSRLFLLTALTVVVVTGAVNPAAACWCHRRRTRLVHEHWVCIPPPPPPSIPPPPPPPPAVDYCQVLRKFDERYVFDAEFSTPAEAMQHVRNLRSAGYEARCLCYSGSVQVCECSN